MKVPTPRQGNYIGMPIQNITFPDGSWIEGEEFAYPHDGFTRKAYVTCEDDKKRVVRCKCADTFFSIPATVVIAKKRVKGYIKCDEVGAKFIAYKK